MKPVEGKFYRFVSVTLIASMLAACSRQATASPQPVLPEGTLTPVSTPSALPSPSPQIPQNQTIPDAKVHLTGHLYPKDLPPAGKTFTECRKITSGGTAFGATWVMNNKDVWDDIAEAHIFNPDGSLFGILSPSVWSAMTQDQKNAIDQTYKHLQPGSKACANYDPTVSSEPQPISPYSTRIPTLSPGQTAPQQSILSSPIAPKPFGENCIVANGDLNVAKALGPDPNRATDAAHYSIHYTDGRVQEYVTPGTVQLGAWGLKRRIQNDPGAIICFYGPGAKSQSNSLAYNREQLNSVRFPVKKGRIFSQS